MRSVGNYQVDNHEYSIGHWPVDKANENLAFLVKTFGQGFVSALDNNENLLDMDLGTAFLKDIISGLFDKLTPEQYAQKVKTWTTGILCDGKPIEYNTHFTGRIMHLHKVIFYILRHQYSDFLDAIPEGLGSKGEASTQESQMSIG